MPFLSIAVTDQSSHLSVILDYCLTQWLLSVQPSNPHLFSFDIFLSHLLAFLNSHIACKHEILLRPLGRYHDKRSAPFLLFPSLFSKFKPFSVLLCSSEEAGDPSSAEVVQSDANSNRSINPSPNVSTSTDSLRKSSQSLHSSTPTTTVTLRSRVGYPR